MKRWIAGLLVGPSAMVAATVAGAEERKPLDDLLVEKGVLTKEEANSVQGRRFASWVDRVAFSGDIRLREDSTWRDAPGESDRHRLRFRLRVGVDLNVQDFTVGIRVASGTGEQFSTNQSFDNLSSQKGLWIDRAYLRWQGQGSKWLTLTGGRMPNPFWTVYSTDAVWDEDVNPEGLAETISVAFGRSGNVFVNLAQIVLDEDSAGSLSTDQWLFGQQVGVALEPVKETKTTVAVTYYNFTNVENNSLGQAACNPGNTRVATVPPTFCPGTTVPIVLLNDYNVLDITGHIAFKAGTLPVELMGDYLVNTANPKDALGQETDDAGYQVGVIVGKASDAKTWELAYFHKVVGTDATVADLADADFGPGGTDRRGDIVWAAYNPTKYLQAKAKFSDTELLSPGQDNVSDSRRIWS
jgi:hypothetical protein